MRGYTRINHKVSVRNLRQVAIPTLLRAQGNMSRAYSNVKKRTTQSNTNLIAEEFSLDS